MSADPLALEAVGLTFRVPVGSTIEQSFVAGEKVLRVAGPAGSWVMGVVSTKPSDLRATVTDALEAALHDVLVYVDPRTGQPVARKGDLLERTDAFEVVGARAAGGRFFVSLIDGDRRVVRGMVIFKPVPERLVRFELSCPEERFAEGKAALEATVSTALFANADALQQQRRELVQRGQEWLQRLKPSDYASAIASGPDEAEGGQWTRLARPGENSAADRERGFRSLRFFRGTRRQIDARVKDDPPGRENPEGLLAEIRARLLNRPPSGDLQVLDVQARYFVSDDRAEEAWSVQTAVRDLRGGKPGLYTETGTRSGRTMTVIINAPGEAPRSIKPTVPPEGYLSQVEVFMLPRLLAAAGMEGDVGFYAYVSAGEAVSLRQDHVSKTDRGWVIRSRQRDRDEPQELTYDVAGHLLGGTLSDGSVLEPTTAEAILKRWQDLGLPAGSMEKRGK